jgi:hypothetical protein
MNRTRNADSLRKRWSVLLSAALFGLLALQAAPAAQAATLEIQFTGLDLYYDGNNIFDNGVHNTTRSGSPADADPLSSIQFYLDNTLVHTITSDVFADVFIADVGAIPVGGALLTSGGNGNDFGIDLLTSSNDPGWGLALDINSLRIFYTGSKIAIAASGLASGIPVQNLPPGLAFDPSEPLTIIMSSANLTGVTTGGGFVTSMHAAGTGNVAGKLVPEPSSIVMLAIGFLGATLLGWRHRTRR